MDDNSEFAGKTPFEDSSNATTPLGLRSVFDFNVECHDFQMDDFGRESLGLIDFNHPDFRRETMSFFCDPRKDDVGRESLGIINFNDDWRRTTNLTVPQITVTDLSCHTSYSPLNVAFLSNSLPSDDSALSFNSKSLLSEPSSIFSTMSNGSCPLNQAFTDSVSFLKQLVNEKYQTVFKGHQRLLSLPSTLENDEPPESDNGNETEKRKIKSDSSVPESQEFPQSNNEFHDSVFFEANHLAYKMANDSIDLGNSEGDMLDSIREPEDLMIDISDEESIKCHELIINPVDEMLPPVVCPKNIVKNQNITVQNNSHNTKHSFKNDEISFSNSSKDPKDIINSLSELLERVSPTEREKSEGQHLLSSLAEMMVPSGNTATSNHLDDSGRSSSGSELMTSQTNECYEVLDLRKKSSSESSSSQIESCDNCAPLDLSMKSRSNNSEKAFSPKILPRKFVNSYQKTWVKESSIGSNCSVSSNEKSLGDLKNINKFKARKVEEKETLRRGPMKAVIPVTKMARKKSIQVTPTRIESHLPKYTLKKTSTPVNGFVVKPMAQSTPEGPPNSGSPLTRHSTNYSPKITKQKLNYSGSSSVKSQDVQNKSFLRRHSISDMKESQEGGKFFKRSNSVGESSGLKANAAKAKQNAMLSISKTGGKNSVANNSVLKENRNRSIVKPNVGKKLGKENVY